MKPAANVVYRDIESSPALNEIIGRKLQKLQRYNDSILHSRVVIDTPHNHKHKGKLYRASLELGLKGAPLNLHCDDESVHIAVRELFNSAERKLKQVSGRKRSSRNNAVEPTFDIDESSVEH